MKNSNRFPRRLTSILKPQFRSPDAFRRYLGSLQPISKSKYETKNGQTDKYLGLYAYGSHTIHSGASESLYQTVDAAILTELGDRNSEYAVLDLGCGVGRTLYHCAPLYPNSLFVGMDLSKQMISYARKMLQTNKSFTHGLNFTGMGNVTLRPKQLKNVVLERGSAVWLPFQNGVFDILVNTYLIDRVPEPQSAIKEMARVLKKRGLLVFTDPLNWEKSSLWEQNPTGKKLMQLFRKQGFFIEEWFDGLIFREVKDSRGNYSDWRTLVIKARKQ